MILLNINHNNLNKVKINVLLNNTLHNINSRKGEK